MTAREYEALGRYTYGVSLSGEILLAEGVLRRLLEGCKKKGKVGNERGVRAALVKLLEWCRDTGVFIDPDLMESIRDLANAKEKAQ